MREVEISEDNKFIDITNKELDEKLNNNESFILFLSSNQCPYCRAIIETADKVSRELDKDIYVIEAWDKDGNELFRDEYVNGDILEHSEVYNRLLELDTHDLLEEWVRDDKDLGRKRIYLPTFLYIENNEIVYIETGLTDELDEDPNIELTEEIKKEIYDKFYDFFNKLKHI